MKSTVTVGAVLWLSAVQFFAAQIVAASAWSTPFSVSSRNISDLGNTACDANAAAPTCSPLHAVMNASFVAIGITMSVGALAAASAFRRGWPRTSAIALFTLAGIGVILVGVYPENENTSVHDLGAGINFITGNLALILFGVSSPDVRSRFAFAPLGIIAGVVGLVASALFAADVDLHVGLGTMERAAAYPIAVWQILTGAVLLRRRGA